MGRRSGEQRKSTSDIRRERALMRDSLPAVLALLLLEAALVLADPGDGAGAWSMLWLALPLIPAVWILRAQLRGLRRADEFQRVEQLEAMAVGFAAMAMLSLAGSLLVASQTGSSQAQWLQITFIGGILSWLGALAVLSRRGR